jgi:hypothetical protein
MRVRATGDRQAIFTTGADQRGDYDEEEEEEDDEEDEEVAPEAAGAATKRPQQAPKVRLHANNNDTRCV